MVGNKTFEAAIIFCTNDMSNIFKMVNDLLSNGSFFVLFGSSDFVQNSPANGKNIHLGITYSILDFQSQRNVKC